MTRQDVKHWHMMLDAMGMVNVFFLVRLHLSSFKGVNVHIKYILKNLWKVKAVCLVGLESIWAYNKHTDTAEPEAGISDKEAPGGLQQQTAYYSIHLLFSSANQPKVLAARWQGFTWFQPICYTTLLLFPSFIYEVQKIRWLEPARTRYGLKVPSLICICPKGV